MITDKICTNGFFFGFGPFSYPFFVFKEKGEKKEDREQSKILTSATENTMERRWYFTIGNIWRSTSTWPFTTFGIQFNSSILAQHPQSVTWWRYLFPPHFHHNGYLGLSEKSKSALLLWFVNDLRKQSHYIIMYMLLIQNEADMGSAGIWLAIS